MSLVYNRGSEQLPTPQQVSTAINNMKANLLGASVGERWEGGSWPWCRLLPVRLGPAMSNNLVNLHGLLPARPPQSAAQPSDSCCKEMKPYVDARCPCDP